AQLLREQAEVPTDFIIASDSDRIQLFREVTPELTERERNQALDRIGQAKNLLVLPGDLGPDHEALQIDLLLYQRYQDALSANQMLDFDDLILQMVKWLEEVPDQLTLLRSRFCWISVDEYQDVNFAQYRLLQLLAGDGRGLCAIGDPDQAIYGFRGADRTYFLRFHDDFAGAKRIELEQNYRSTQMILQASYQVISQEADRAAMQVWSDFVDQTRLDLYQAATDKAEAEYVIHQIEQMVGGTSYFSLDSGRVDDDDELANRSFGDFAILVRLSAQMPPIIEALERSGIPYQAVGRTPLVELKEIQEILAYLWLLANPNSQYLRDKIEKRLQAPLLIDPFIGDLRQQVGQLPVTEFIETIDAFILEQHPNRDRESRRENVQRFGRLAISFETRLLLFLETMALQRDADVYDARADRVTLMSLHASKGLEFPVVFMTGCEESILPYELGRHQADVDEERRLFYVGMTRAQQKLILSHAKSRVLFGQYLQNQPSRFVDDIEQSLKELKKMAPSKPKAAKPEAVQLGLFGV
ncbi:MAG: 3'-5' exonuclease, partial [Chloroflexota bacterium]